MTQQAYNKFNSIIRPEGLLITDTRFVSVERKVDARQVPLPMYQNVMEKIGKPIVFNVCMLGAVIGLTRLVKPESILRVLQNRIPPGFLKINQEALELGEALVADYRI